MINFYQSCNPEELTTPLTQQLCPFVYHKRNTYTMFTGHCRKTYDRLLLQSAVNSQTLKQADGILQHYNQELLKCMCITIYTHSQRNSLVQQMDTNANLNLWSFVLVINICFIE